MYIKHPFISYQYCTDTCGQKFTQDFNIIGGEQADPNAYPWMVRTFESHLYIILS